MARTNPYRAAYSDELDERARVAGSKASTTASATVSEPVAQGQPSLDLSGLTAPPAKETPGSDTSQTMQAVLNLSLAGVKAAAKSPEGGDIGDVNLVYLQYLRMQGGGTDAGLDRLMNATAGGPVSKAAFVNARSY